MWPAQAGAPKATETMARSLRLAGNHDLGGLDDGQRRLAAPELELVDGIACDDRREPLVADAQADLREESFHPDLVDYSAQLVPPAEGDDHALWPPGTPRCSGHPALCGQQTIDLQFRNPMMAAAGANRSDGALIDPLLECGVTDAKPLRGRANGEEGHVSGAALVRPSGRAKA